MLGLLQRDRCVALLVAGGTFLVFLFSPVRQVSDSAYALLVSESLLHRQELHIDQYVPEYEKWREQRREAVYNLESLHGRLYYMFPNAGSVLAVPFVAALDAIGLTAVGSDGSWDRFGEVQAQGVIASILMAAFVSLVYVTSRLVAERGTSLVVAVVTAFGTQVWSTTSRVMWSDTWGILLLMVAVWASLRLEVTGRGWNVLLHGTVLGWVFFVRPTNSVHIVFSLLYLALLSWRRAVGVGAVAAAWLAAFMAHSMTLYDRPLPSYFLPQRLTGSQPLVAFAGNLISPSRGFLVGVPCALFVLYLLIRYRDRLPRLRFVPIAFAACMAHFIPIVLFEHWWGGYSYGPRLTTGLLPWGVVLAAIAAATWCAAHPQGLPRAERWAAAVLVTASVFIHGHGSTVWEGARWNYRPASVDLEPSRLWSWRYPQWLAGIVGVPERTYFPRLWVGENLEFGDRASEPFLGDGWSYGEGTFRWSEDSSAWVLFDVPQPEAVVLRMMLQPGPNWRREPGGQSLQVELNGRLIGVLALTSPSPSVYAIPLETGAFATRNRLRFHVPTRAKGTPALFDLRPLRTAAFWLRLDRYPPLEDGEAVAFGNPFLGSYLGSGWGEGEEHYRWTVGSHADIVFRSAGTGARVVDLTLRTFLSAALREQRVHVRLNGVLTHLLTVDDLAPRRYSLPFTEPTLREFNTLTLDLPDSHSPASAGLGSDTRPLGVAVHTVGLRRFPPFPASGGVPWGSPAAQSFLAHGWSEPEAPARWNHGLTAGIVFSVPEGVRQGRLVFDWEPFLVRDAVPSQHVRVTCNGTSVGTYALDDPRRRRTVIPLPPAALGVDNVVVLSFPDARSPLSFGLSPDPRRLAVKVYAVSFQPGPEAPAGEPSPAAGRRQPGR